MRGNTNLNQDLHLQSENTAPLIRNMNEWLSHGFTEIAAKRWSDAGFNVYDGAMWRYHGVSVQDAVTLQGNGSYKTIETAIEWLDCGYKAVDIAIYMNNRIPMKVAKKWRKAGFDAETASVWWACGITPSEAVDLRERNISPVQLTEWLSEGYSFEYSVSKCEEGVGVLEDEERWRALGIHDNEKAIYMALGVFDLNLAAEWSRMPNGVQLAIKWAEHGVLPQEATAWAAIGLGRGDEDLHWMKSGASPTAAKEWSALRLTPEDFVLWSGLYLRAEDVFACKQLGLSTPIEARHRMPEQTTPVEALIWRQCGIALDEICRWRDADFSPEEAGKYKEAGYTPESAKQDSITRRLEGE